MYICLLLLFIDNAYSYCLHFTPAYFTRLMILQFTSMLPEDKRTPQADKYKCALMPTHAAYKLPAYMWTHCYFYMCVCMCVSGRTSTRLNSLGSPCSRRWSNQMAKSAHKYACIQIYNMYIYIYLSAMAQVNLSVMHHKYLLHTHTHTHNPTDRH